MQTFQFLGIHIDCHQELASKCWYVNLAMLAFACTRKVSSCRNTDPQPLVNPNAVFRVDHRKGVDGIGWISWNTDVVVGEVSEEWFALVTTVLKL